jgi:glutamyl-tRNA reductase
MPLTVLGVNHRTAPVDIREKVAFDRDQLGGALQELVGYPTVAEVVIVSTCNRTELYGEYRQGGVREAREWLIDYHRMPGALDECLYTFERDRAISHTFSVACGLDSAILGEPQILGQMKDAYRAAREAGSTGPVLNHLFQQAFSVAKLVRTDTEIGASAVSVAYAAVSLARQIFAKFSSHCALLVGAGETVELTARHLRRRGIGNMIIANRNLRKAQALAHEFKGFAIGLDDLPDHMADADIIITATASREPLIRKSDVEQALRARRRKPIFIADLAVPRDVDASVADLRDVYLYTVDDLQDVIRDNLRSRQAAARQAEQIIEAEVARFFMAQRVRDAAPTIRAVRGRAAGIRDETTRQALRLLESGRDAESVIGHLAHTLTNKLLHAPSTRLRKAGEEGDDVILDAARSLFGIDDDQ